jgi:hypothetical protein
MIVEVVKIEGYMATKRDDGVLKVFEDGETLHIPFKSDAAELVMKLMKRVKHFEDNFGRMRA